MPSPRCCSHTAQEVKGPCTARVRPLCADGQLEPALTAGLLLQTQATAAGLGRSLCFDRDSQIKAFVLRRHVMAKGNYTHLSALPLIANYW